jgi:signal transduction histidine kinase
MPDVTAPDEGTPSTIGWRERLGGPNAVSLPAWLLFAPLSLIATVTYAPGGLSHPTGWQWLTVGVIAYLASGPVLLLAWATVLRPYGRRARPVTTAVVLLAASQARNVAFGAGSVAAGLAPSPYYGHRLTTIALVQASWLALATVLVDGQRRARRTQASLHAQLARRDRLRADAERLLADRRTQIAGEVVSTVDAAVDDVRTRACSLAGAARRLRVLVDDVVRPLSMQLETEPAAIDDHPVDHAGAPPARRSVGALVDAVTTTAPFPRTVPATVTVIATLPLVLYFGNQLAAPFVVLALGAIVYGGHELADRGTRAWRARASRSARVATIVALWLLVGAMVAAPVSLMTSMSATLPQAELAIVISLLTVTVGSAAALGIHARREEVARELRRAISDADSARAELVRLAEHDQRRLARTVHGQVQARIIGAALVLEQAERDGSAPDLDALLDRLREACRRAFDQPESPDVRTQLHELATVWGIAAEVEIELRDDTAARLETDRHASEAIVAVVGEALTNAIRHGGARSVRIRASWEPMTSEVLVVVDDDGRLDARGEPGVGSHLFDDHTRWWTLTPGDGGTRFTARIALRAQAVEVG